MNRKLGKANFTLFLVVTSYPLTDVSVVVNKLGTLILDTFESHLNQELEK